MNEQKTVTLGNGWMVTSLVDDDGHLNVYILNMFCDEIEKINTGQGDGHGEQLAMRFTTDVIEEAAADEFAKDFLTRS